MCMCVCVCVNYRQLFLWFMNWLKLEVKVWSNDFSDIFKFNKSFLLYPTDVYIWYFLPSCRICVHFSGIQLRAVDWTTSRFSMLWNFLYQRKNHKKCLYWKKEIPIVKKRNCKCFAGSVPSFVKTVILIQCF